MPEVTDLLLMQQRLRQCATLSQLAHFVVNDSTRIAPYRTAVLWVGDESGKIEGVSGLPEPIANIPFTDWANSVCKNLVQQNVAESSTVDHKMLAERDQSRWSDFFPGTATWIPLNSADRKLGGLLLGRDEVWPDEELKLLDYWAGAVAHAISVMVGSTVDKAWHWKRIKEKRVLWTILGVVAIILCLPISLSVNSSGEVVPKNPIVVRSPLDGIIGEVFVAPNADVKQGDTIIAFDDTSIKAQMDVVNQELAIAKAELQRATQASVSDRRMSSELPTLQARVEQSEARVSYTQSLLERSQINAQTDGIVIIPSASELEGKPVRIGEKLFTLAERGNVELDFWVAVGDSIPLAEEAPVELFLNVYPDQSHSAIVRYLSYQAEVSPAGILGYRGRADFVDGTNLRVGWRGTAKVYGERVSVAYFIFRRPLSILRQWLGV